MPCLKDMTFYVIYLKKVCRSDFEEIYEMLKTGAASGDVIFTTRPEAEAKLKQLKGKEK